MWFLHSLTKLDKTISKWIHNKDNIVTTVILYPFAAFFHPGLIWLAYLTVYLFSHGNIRFTAVYLFATIICLLTTTLIKKIANRPRPQLDEKAKKPHHFRKKQKNNAMPSGDAIQSALFVVFLYFLELNLGWLILFHLGVCLGRVYYMCHWVADTFIASILGTIIGKLLLYYYESSAFAFLPLEL